MPAITDKKIIAAAITIITISVIFQFGFFKVMMDDPFITFRYALNAVSGNGIVWNPGERVEGYSNFLFLILIMPFAAMKANLYFVSKILGIMFNIGTMILCLAYSEKYFKDSPFLVKIASLLFLAFSMQFALWGTGGLETSLFGLLALTAIYLTAGYDDQKRNIPLAIILFLLSITRPEGFIFFIISLIWIKVFLPFMKDKGTGIEEEHVYKAKNDIWILLFLSLFCSFLLWRYLYYGSLLPNTVAAKMGGGIYRVMQGAKYTLDFFKTNILPLIVIIVSSLFFTRRSSLSFILLTAIAGYTGFIIYSGGDWMPAFRFFIPILPFFALLFQDSIGLLYEKMPFSNNYRNVILAVILCLIFPLNSFIQYKQIVKETSWIKNILFSGFAETQGEYNMIADYIKHNAKDNNLVAIQEAGKIPYLCMNLRFLDVVGLNDKTIAQNTKGFLHSDGNSTEYILSRKPDLMALWVNVNPDGSYKWSMPAVENIIKNPATKSDYEMLDILPRPKANESWTDGHVYYIYKRKTI